MEVSLVRILRPLSDGAKYDYSIYSNTLTNILIPLEVIYRNSPPAGSSIFRRLENGSLTLEEIGLKEMPKAKDVLDKPILDASTKLEVTDRYLSWEEAQSISALTDQELEEIKRATNKINDLITEHVSRADMVNEDGKVDSALMVNAA